MYEKDIDPNEYPREQLHIPSGKNQLSAFLYRAERNQGLIVLAPGHRDTNDIKLYEIRYFVDAGFSVICFDYTGCYTSEGKSMIGYSQSVHDLDAVLSYIEAEPRFAEQPLYLFGHSMGAYAAGAVLQYHHNVKKAIVASGFDTPKEQWQYSIKKYTGPVYLLLKLFNDLYIQLKYGKDAELSAVDGINSVDVPVLVISGEKDSFYGGPSPIYSKRKQITNPNVTYLYMQEKKHNGHYDYFLTDEALQYAESKPSGKIDKELFMQHDAAFIQKLIDFYQE